MGLKPAVARFVSTRDTNKGDDVTLCSCPAGLFALLFTVWSAGAKLEPDNLKKLQ